MGCTLSDTDPIPTGVSFTLNAMLVDDGEDDDSEFLVDRGLDFEVTCNENGLTFKQMLRVLFEGFGDRLAKEGVVLGETLSFS